MCVYFLSNVCNVTVYIFLSKCVKGGKDKEKRGNTPNTQKRGGETTQNAAKGPHAVHGQKTDTITLREGKLKNVKRGNAKTPKGRKPKNT